MTEMLTMPETDPLLRALAAKHPDLDPIRWIVRLPSGARVHVAGDKVATDDSRRLVFALDDGTQQVFEHDEWSSAIAAPGKVGPDLDQIIRRLHLFGLADLHDVINQGAWLQAQPEWIERERIVEGASALALADAERIHALRKMGF